jgi:hypothetical protein
VTMLTNTGIEVYDLGDPANLIADFVNTAGAATDPTSVDFYYRAPDGTITTVLFAALTNDPLVGRWTYAFTLPTAATASGIWRWGAIASGAVTQVEETCFYVRRSLLFPVA